MIEMIGLILAVVLAAIVVAFGYEESGKNKHNSPHKG